MKKENSPNPKKVNNFLAAAVSLILAVALFAIDLFLLLNQPRNFIGLIGTTFLMLIWVYFFVRSIFQEMEQNKQEMTSYLEAMLKSEKAFFLMQRKVLNEMQQFGEDAKLPSEEIITAQKAIAKVTINRSRENTDALMNSNNQLLDRLADFEDKLSSFHTDVPETEVRSDNSMMESSVRDILAEQRTIVENMQRMEAAIKDEVLKAVNSINEMQSKMPVYVQQPVIQEEITGNDDIGTVEEYAGSNDIGTAEEYAGSNDIGTTEEYAGSSDIGAPEDIIIDSDMGSQDLSGSPVEGDIVVPTQDDEEELPDLDELLNSIGDLGMPSEPTVIPEPEPIVIPEPAAEPEPEPIVIPEPTVTPEPEPIVIPEPVAEPEPKPVEQKPTMPDMSNPNKMMTPDEIAALLANL